MRTNASILVGVLWCLALLSVIVIGVLHLARLDLLVVKNHGDRIQAHYLALAGIEKAKALLCQNAREHTRSGRNHSGEYYDAPEDFRDVAFGRGQFRVFRHGREDEGGGVIYGISDEESRLNVNTASAEELGKLYGMRPDMVAAIIDWRDQDDEVTPGGAEADYYASLQPPYLPRNGPLLTLRELLMVRDVSPDLLFGDDVSQNGLLDSADGSGGGLSSRRNGGAVPDAGWSDLLTVDSGVKNLSAAGIERVNVQEADERSLEAVRGITPEIARAIIASRGQNKLESLADLLEVGAGQAKNQPGQPRGAPGDPNASGPKVISQELLMEIADDVTAGPATQPGLVNINTATLPVLICLPGMTRELAQAVISYRQSSGYFPNVAWLLKVPGMSREMFKQVARRVSARSETFRIVSEGKVNSTGARQRIQVIVHIGLQGAETLSYREDL